MQKATQKPVEGKVAKILNSRELVLNRGSDDGVELDMKFRVMGREVVIDPDTKEELGYLERETIKVKAVSVEARFSIAQTYETYQVGGGVLTLFSQAFPGLTRPPTTVVRRIRTSELENPETSITQDVFVQIGDRVTQLVEDEAKQAEEASS